SNWTHKHEAWLGALSFPEPGAGLGASRRVSHRGALGRAAEVGDWRRVERAASCMGFVGRVPSEYSSGGSTWRGHLTKAGNAHILAASRSTEPRRIVETLEPALRPW
ncbi:MAG TPA: transposase, partial [Acidimicrobiales bacterium]|nr:transposase [Acidimicrobiales bacterium]